MTPVALIIAEKPQAARRIAEALGAGRGSRRRLYGVTYWEFRCRLGVCVVASSVGHIFGLDAPSGPPPVFEYEWKPLWMIDRSAAYTKKYYSVLKKLSGRASIYINACDYDIEGSLIGYLIILFLGDPRRAKRMRFSTLTKEDIVRAFNNLEPLDYPMIEAGKARHILDWLWGINVSRLLMEAVKRSSGRRIILSAGRVQSPTLLEVLRRDLANRLHVPLPSFRVSVRVRLGGVERDMKLSPAFERKRDAEEAAAMLRASGVLRVKQVKRVLRRMPPPPPFNLGDLQAEAARIYGMSPYNVQRIAEQLYLDALISYPRTDSQVIPPTINVRRIVEGLATQPEYRGLVGRLLRETHGVLTPRKGRKTDPAHPAIHPTGVAPERRLTRDERRIYDLVVRRFLASMAKPALIESAEARLEGVGGLYTVVRGLRIVEEGWLAYYPYAAPEEKAVPPLRQGMVLPVSRVRVVAEYTAKPSLYTKASLIRWMESVNIGTKSTRARIVELLIKRKYIESRRNGLRVTDLGYAVATALERNVPKLVSVELTREFEEMLQEIMEGRRSVRDVVEAAKKLIASIVSSVNGEKMTAIGNEISMYAGLLKPKARCPICGRPSTSTGLCELHLMAVRALKDMEKEWARRMGEDGTRYLSRMCKMRSAGELVREAACWLLEKTQLY